ncbi:MAG: ABC transporter ATP-binding protein [bacterium]
MANSFTKMNQITVKNLNVSYKNHSALENVSFEVSKGEFVAIVGKSGSGKSSLLHALANFIPYQGEVSLSGNIGMVFQNYAAFPWLTVSENIAFGLKGDTKDNCAMVNEHLKLAELEDKADAYPDELSGGQVQRVAIARSLAHNTDVLLMDEPYGALDAYTRDKMQKWLLDVWTTHKKTVIFVTHNIEEALFLADRVLVLHPTGFTKEFIVPFPRPRNPEIKFTEEFNQLRKEIYGAI